jgi:hypothetical protein
MKDVKQMTNKAYIVANKQQEREVLEKLEEKGALWGNGKNATNFIPFRTFPYVIYCNGDKYIFWDKLGDLDVDKIIAFDGRNEEQMSEKCVVSQEFMNELKEWKEFYITDTLEEKYHYVSAGDLDTLPGMIKDWWIGLNKPIEKNNRLITIIRWVNGEDVFEVEKPKKWVVHELNTKLYVTTYDGHTGITPNRDYITKFDTKEEAESWANSHQEVIEVVDV